MCIGYINIYSMFIIKSFPTIKYMFSFSKEYMFIWHIDANTKRTTLGYLFNANLTITKAWQWDTAYMRWYCHTELQILLCFLLISSLLPLFVKMKPAKEIICCFCPLSYWSIATSKFSMMFKCVCDIRNGNPTTMASYEEDDTNTINYIISCNRNATICSTDKCVQTVIRRELANSDFRRSTFYYNNNG